MKTHYLLMMLAVLLCTSAQAQTVLVTGSNRGIGLEFVKQYAEQGWNVIATARRPQSADDLQALAAKYKTVTIEQLDVTDERRIAELAKAYQGTPIDVLINNAGVLGNAEGQAFGTFDKELFELMMAVNVFAPMKMSEAFARHVAASDRKKIVVISSRNGSIASLNREPGRPYYAVSKTAVNMAMRGISLTLAKQGVLVGIYMPGGVNTRMLRRGFGATEANENDANFDFGRFVPLTPQQSVEHLRARIDELDAEKSGLFFNYDGNSIPW